MLVSLNLIDKSDTGVPLRIRRHYVIRTLISKRKQYGVRVKSENEVHVRETYGFIKKKYEIRKFLD